MREKGKKKKKGQKQEWGKKKKKTAIQSIKKSISENEQ